MIHIIKISSCFEHKLNIHLTDIKFWFEQIKAIGQTELNSSNPEEVLQLAAQKRKKKFLQAMAKLYF